MAGYLSIFTEQLCLLYACYFIICFFLATLHSMWDLSSLRMLSCSIMSDSLQPHKL